MHCLIFIPLNYVVNHSILLCQQICLPSIISNPMNQKIKLWKTVTPTSFQNQIATCFSLLQVGTSAASKIGSSVISLLCQLQCGCKPDRNKYSSFSNTTVVVIFPNLCLWRRSLCSNLGRSDPGQTVSSHLKKHCFFSTESIKLRCNLFICSFLFILLVFFSSKISRSIDGREKYNRCVG